ncbi:DciA family protein [Thermodesulfobacteriota bacterium]
MQKNNRHKPVEISRLLSAVFENKKWRSKLELHRVFEFWDRTVGKEIAAVAQPSLIRSRSVLWVKVRDSIWMQQLHLQKMLLLEKINRQLNGEQLSDIHFQLDSSLSAPPEPETEKTKPALPDKKKEQEFDKLISCLENDALKVSLKSLWVKMQNKGK